MNTKINPEGADRRPSMAQVALGGQGLTVSAQGLGCMGMSTTYGPSDESENLATLARALELGITFFDTAEVYGPFLNEALLGRALAGQRDRILLATKVGFRFAENGKLGTVDDQPIVTGDPAYLSRAVEGSLRRLRTDVIDLLYLHRIATDVPIEETVGGLSRLVEAGKVRFLGVSEASPDSIRRAHATHPLSAVQAEYSLFERGVERNGVLETVRELGIGFVSYSPLGRGFLTGALKSVDGLDRTDFRRTDPRFQSSALAANLALIDRIVAMAEAKGVKPSQLAIAWAMRMGTVPIPGTRRVRYLEDNAAAGNVILTDNDLRTLDAIAPAGAAKGDRYSPGMMKVLNN